MHSKLLKEIFKVLTPVGRLLTPIVTLPLLLKLFYHVNRVL